jgi:hypothetical protein
MDEKTERRCGRSPRLWYSCCSAQTTRDDAGILFSFSSRWDVPGGVGRFIAGVMRDKQPGGVIVRAWVAERTGHW